LKQIQHMRTIALAIQKGGTGKSTTAVNLAAALAERGNKVLLIDNDPQGTATNYSDVTYSHTISDVYHGLNLQAAAAPWIPGIDIVPSDILLTQAEQDITQRKDRYMILKNAISCMTAYDFCIIDTAPGLGLLTINALAAADKIIIPLEPSPATVKSLQLFFDTLDMIRPANPGLSYMVLWTFYDGRLKLHQAADEAAAAANIPLYPVTIARNVRTAEAFGAHEPLLTYDPGNKNNAAYRTIAEMESTK